jgi:hypothetical protein
MRNRPKLPFAIHGCGSKADVTQDTPERISGRHDVDVLPPAQLPEMTCLTPAISR